MTQERKKNRNSKLDKRVDKRQFRVLEGQKRNGEERERKYTFKPVQAKNEFQKRVFVALANKQVVVISSPAGTGKSFLTMSKALEEYTKGHIHKICLSRPAVGMANSLGLLKGGIKEKYEPYLMPLISVIKESLGNGFYECGISNETIELLPMEYLRGRNLDGYTILDESQNASASELYSILTRITETGKLVLLGDKTQHDLHGEDGLTWLRKFVNNNNLHDKVEFIEGTSDDIVRSELVNSIVKAKENETGIYTN